MGEPCFTPSCLIGFFFFHIHFLYIHIHIIMVLYKEWSLNCVSCVIVVRLYLVITCGEHVKELDSYGVGCKFAQKRCCMLSNFISSFHDFFIIVDVVDVWNYCTKLFLFFCCYGSMWRWLCDTFVLFWLKGKNYECRLTWIIGV